MSIASEPKRCPKCGGLIPAEAPQGLCPKCLLLEASVPTDAGKGESARPVAPARAELAAAFPQLEILELIGQGGMGFVFKARQPKLDRFVALKILPQSLAADPAFAERFTREGRVLARLNHPNIVTIHDFGQADGFFYLLMEFVDGVNLRQAMHIGRFTPAQALVIVPKICEALQFAHNEGILHRDIKPENILLDTKGRVKIADFGIAKLVGDVGRAGSPLPAAAAPGDHGAHGVTRATALTETGKTLGTPQYMAPEQLEHPQDVDQRADIYSLGVVFYEMLTGELPIGRFAPPSERSAVDPRVDKVVLRTLEKERERRQQSAGEVKMQVETIAATPDPSSSRREEAQIEFAKSKAEWGKRMPLLSPFQSPEVRDICAHLTKAESNQVSLLGFLCGVWVVAAVFGIPILIKSFPRPGNWIVGSVFGLVFVVTLPMLSRIGRQLLCSTAWAKVQGFTPAQLRLFSFRGTNLWKGLAVLLVLLTLLIVQRKAIINYLGLSALPQPHQARERQQDKPPVLPAATFGPVIERVMTKMLALDFDTDKAVTLGLDGYGRLRDIYYWPVPEMRKQGLDVILKFNLDNLIPDGLKLISLSAESWDTMSPERLIHTLQAIDWLNAELPPEITVGTDGLATYGFETREGGIGLFQFTGLNDVPRGVKIRYKLVQQGDGAGATPGARSMESVRFGPEKEVTLTEFNNRDGQEALDLDTGTLLKQPTDIHDWSDPGLGRWVKENGVDLFADRGPGGVWGLLTTINADLKVALVEKEQWDGIKESALAAALSSGPAPLVVQQRGIMKVYIPPKDARPPITFVFKTGKGSDGLLQIIGDSDSPRGVRVRYKLVQAEKK